MSENVLLVCSVGGTPAPLVGSLKHWRPQRVIFVVSPETHRLVADEIVPRTKAEGMDVPPGCYDYVVFPDSQDFSACLGRLHELDPEVEKWLARGAGHAVVVDYTGGTKTMTAALVAHARRWPCRFSYVGGAERTKDGVGVVVDGRETIVHAYNPWDSLGYQAVEDFVVLFDQHAYGPAAASLEAAMRRMSSAAAAAEPTGGAGPQAPGAVVRRRFSPARGRELKTLKSLAEAYAAWDLFDHKKAANMLRSVDQNANDLRPLLSPQAREGLLPTIRLHVDRLNELQDSPGVSRAAALDLLSNARRRKAEGRYDDAVARLYRAVEALAQDQLRRAHGIADTGKVPLALVPLSLRARYPADATELMLGLQEAYLLLRELGDPLGQRFAGLGWHEREHSPLVARNQSILAHGFTPVGAKVFESLWSGCLALAGTEEGGLPAFPTLGRPRQASVTYA